MLAELASFDKGLCNGIFIFSVRENTIDEITV
jgi:hypothetical protein